MSRVLLIYPPISAKVPAKSTLLGLGYLASVLRNRGHEVKIHDFINGIPLNLPKWNFDIMGVSAMFTEYRIDICNFLTYIKEQYPTLHVIVGGAHASTYPEEMIEFADCVVVGEGEEVICDIVENRRKGIVRAERIRDLDKLPMPAWDLMMEDNKELNRRNVTSPFVMRQPIIHMITSRGCPNNCTFCALKASWGRQWIPRSAENVVDEIEHLYNMGFREIYFNDDNCSVDKRRMYEICDLILIRGITVKIACPTGIHINSLSKPLLKLMKQAGFYRLCFGIETGSPEMQKKIKKNLDLDKAKQVIKDANDLGYWTSATFIIGFPSDCTKNDKTKLDTLKFPAYSNLDFPIYYQWIPQPKTELYNTVLNKTTIYAPGQLQPLINWGYKEFIKYKIFSPTTYINILKKIRSWEDLRFTIRLLWHARKIVFKRRVTNESVLGR